MSGAMTMSDTMSTDALPVEWRAPSYDPRSHQCGTTWTEAAEYGVRVRTYDVVPRDLGVVVAEKIAETKAEAARRILSVAPAWRQANLTARAADLALTYPGVAGDDLPEPERSEYLAGREIWRRIVAIRSASNAIEAALTGLADRPDATAADVAAFDVTAHPFWEA